MRRITSGVVLAVSVSAAAFATAATSHDVSQAQKAGRQVMICAQDAATRRAFTREHGAAPVFVTASQAISLRRSDAPWTSPRCMTEREHGLYQDQIRTFAAVR